MPRRASGWVEMWREEGETLGSQPSLSQSSSTAVINGSGCVSVPGCRQGLPWMDRDSPAIKHHNQESTLQPACAASPLLEKRGHHNLKLHVSFESSPPLSTSPHHSLHPFNPSPNPLHSLSSYPSPTPLPRLHSPTPPTPPRPSSTFLNPSSISLRPSLPHSIPIHPYPSGVGGRG